MKNVFNMIIAVMLVFLIGSCSDDDGGSSSVNADLIGTWDLTEVRVSSSIDVDGDGSSSSNLLDEADCISGTLTIREDMTWEFQQSAFTISSITNNQYAVQCSGTNLGTGAWASNSTQIQFQGSSLLGTLQISNNQIIKTEGDNLPGVQSYTYTKRQ